MASPEVQSAGTGRFRRVPKSLCMLAHVDGVIRLQGNSLLLCLFHKSYKLLRQALAVHLHGIALAASTDGDVGQCLARLVSLLGYPRDDPRRRIVLVQRSTQLLPRLRQVLLERMRLQNQRIPLVLEGAEHGRYRGEVGRARSDDIGRLELDEVLRREILASNGVGVVF